MASSDLPNWASTLLFVAFVSWAWSNDMSPLTTDSIKDGTLLNSVTSNDKLLHSQHWPFGLMLTLHVINTVSQKTKKRGFWASDIMNCAFSAFGAYMMNDLLAGDFHMPFLFANKELFLSLLVCCWYLVNHNIPMTKVNAWKVISGKVGKHVPLTDFMNLCTLAFNSAVLIHAANQGAAQTNFFNLPALGKIVFTCVALHCSGEYFNSNGINFHFKSCSASCERATWVAVWCATNALATFPVIGGVVGGWTHWIEAFFGGRSNFLITTILLDSVIGHLLPFQKPHEFLASKLYAITGVSDDPYADGADSDEEESPDHLNDPLGASFLLLAMTAGISWFWNNGMEKPSVGQLTDGSIWNSLTSNDRSISDTHWPFGLALTLHVINSVKSTGGHWAADVINCVFAAFGSLMMKDLLAGHVGMPFLWANKEAYFSLVLVSWYFVNHNIPFTSVNVWDTIRGNLARFVPIGKFMNLCSLTFNCQILIGAVANATATHNFLHMPTLGLALLTSVAIHCSGEFFTQSGIQFNLQGCSENCERAALVAFWCATEGLSAFPIVGNALGTVTGKVEGFFGGRSNFLLTAILVDAIFGHLLQGARPHRIITDIIYKITGVNNGENDADEDDDEDDGMDCCKDITMKHVLAALVASVAINWKNEGWLAVPDVHGITTGGSALHSKFWPFGLLLTLHVINSVKSSGGYWASDIVRCVFGAFGSIMVQQIFAGSLTMPFLFENNEALLTLVIVCWYFVNHSIPFTGINVWRKASGFLKQFGVPVNGILSVSSLAFNCNILIATAMNHGTAANTFYHLPAVGAILFTCVAVHCAGDFFNTEGISFNLFGCSDACERACWVAIWCATDALASFPFVGGLLGALGATAEGMFGGRANFLITTILLDATIGHVWKFERPHQTIAKALYKFTGVRRR